ncbi:tyrosine-type recombinase/integrase [Brevundimonas nasdae]|uniref:tyrosine-type recombinase/integrase n=1 Tax=Brevundimonas nasdae TaxID=172043 RepID=UPI003017F1F2
MPKAQLTAAYIEALKCPPGKAKIEAFDTIIPGFTFERRASGHGTYYLRHSVDGRQKQLKICCERDATFAQVRKKAQLLRSEVVLGGDPGTKKALAKSIPLYAELSAQHLAHAKLHLKSYNDLESSMRVHIVPKWGKIRLTDITSQAVGQWLNEKRNSGLAPASVEKLRVILGRSFALGASLDIPGTERNPARGIPRKPLNNARERFLTAEEAARLKAAVEKSQNSQLQHIVGLLLLTGVRLRELLDAEFKNVDIERRSWFIPTSKTGKSRHVPLSTAAIAIIEKLPRFKGCPWLVPNPDTKLPYVSLKGTWKTAIKVAKLPGLRLHDLRHSAASFMVNSGVDLFTVGKVLGHANVASTARYSHLANDTLLKAVEAGASKQAAF